MSDTLFDGTVARGKISMVQRNTFWELGFENESNEIQLGPYRRARYDSDVDYCDFSDKEESTTSGIVDESDETDSICSLTTQDDLESPTQFMPPIVQSHQVIFMQMTPAAAIYAQPMSFVPSWEQASAQIPRNGAELAQWHDQNSMRRSAGSSRREARKWQAPKGSKGHSSSTASTSASDSDRKQRPSGCDAAAEPGFTTIIFRNLPKSCTRDILTKTMDANGFARCYDFVHVPVSFSDLVGLGYALVNMVDHECADRAQRFFSGFRDWSIPSTEACEVGWSSSNQGLAAHIERYRNSP
jgi:hypothetical protein